MDRREQQSIGLGGDTQWLGREKWDTISMWLEQDVTRIGTKVLIAQAAGRRVVLARAAKRRWSGRHLDLGVDISVEITANPARRDIPPRSAASGGSR